MLRFDPIFNHRKQKRKNKMIRQTIHNVVNVEVQEIDTAKSSHDNTDFHTRTIRATDEKGNVVEIVLFSDIKNNLKI